MSHDLNALYEILIIFASADSTIGPCIQSMDQIPVTIQINLISIPVLLAW